MKERIKRLALWLGVIEYRNTERETQQRVDQLMFELASLETWNEYINIRWDLPNVNKPRQPQEA